MIQEKSAEFQQIPGVGKSIARDLWNLGYRTVSDLRGENPEEIYKKLCEYQKQSGATCRCMLYVFRLAVYYAENDTHDPELLKWWNWKDPA